MHSVTYILVHSNLPINRSSCIPIQRYLHKKYIWVSYRNKHTNRQKPVHISTDRTEIYTDTHRYQYTNNGTSILVHAYETRYIYLHTLTVTCIHYRPTGTCVPVHIPMPPQGH